MSSKKLQGILQNSYKFYKVEVEKTLKKINEGLEEFEETMKKLYGSNSQLQREKIEADLKKEIKKLQRLRDQVKTWQTMSEIKDKEGLEAARKKIEQVLVFFIVRKWKGSKLSKRKLRQKHSRKKV